MGVLAPLVSLRSQELLWRQEGQGGECRARRAVLPAPLDPFGLPGFTLLTGSDGGTWRDAAATFGAELAVPIACYAVGSAGLEDRDGTFFERFGLETTGAVLVRPDGYVGWRTRSACETDALRQALARILDRNG